jgi:hypothetical protein
MDKETILRQIARGGYASLTTAQKEVYNNSLSLPSLAATGQPTIPTAPITPETPATPTLPQNQPTNNLLEFKNTMSQVVNLARDKRNELMLKFMGSVAPSGTMAASDFSSILSNLNRASDITTEDITKNIVEQQTPVYDTITDDAGNIYQVQQDPLTKKIIGKPELIFKGEPSTKETPEEKLLTNFKDDLFDWDMTGTREQLIRKLQAKYPEIDPNDISRKVYETYPNGYDQ